MLVCSHKAVLFLELPLVKLVVSIGLLNQPQWLYFLFLPIVHCSFEYVLFFLEFFLKFLFLVPEIGLFPTDMLK
jgi:hypothetical protein